MILNISITVRDDMPRHELDTLIRDAAHCAAATVYNEGAPEVDDMAQFEIAGADNVVFFRSE